MSIADLWLVRLETKTDAEELIALAKAVAGANKLVTSDGNLYPAALGIMAEALAIQNKRVIELESDGEITFDDED